MIDLPVVDSQPYPDSRPWIDLRPYLEPSWRMDSPSYHFRGMIDGNTATIHLRTSDGTNETLAPTLPEAFWPPGNMVFQAFSPWRNYPLGMFLRASNGELKLYNPGNLYADGTLVDLVCQFSYTRKAG